jgi:hypothetical protein
MDEIKAPELKKCKHDPRFACKEEVECALCLGLQARDLAFTNYINIQLMLRKFVPEAFAPTNGIIKPSEAVKNNILNFKGDVK